uniref:PB1-like domain-containing protein n=1 Tax=Oryza punctata TaxID=4537 RepID=A0A0E0KRF3_ORYPU
MGMDVLDTLVVRFHLKGVFVLDGSEKKYCGGSEALSYVDRDKVSLPELFGHLKDHCNVMSGTLLHWLFPGKDLQTGLRVLSNDKACKLMCDCTEELDVADMGVRRNIVVDLRLCHRDKVSLPELFGHLKDHCNVMSGTLLHWLFPGKDLQTGLRVLSNDKACKLMCDCTEELDVADVYVEEPEIVDLCNGSDDDSDWEAEMELEVESEEEGGKMKVDIDVSKGKGIHEVGGSGCKGKELAEEETDRRIVIYHSDSAPIASHQPC